MAKKVKGTSHLAKISLNAGRVEEGSREIVDVLTFVESEWGLGMPLYPVQRVILKAYYGLALDDDPANRFLITDWKRENPRYFTEAEYLRHLYDEKRCNIREVIPGQERRYLTLSIGRRSGKTLLSSCISAYETYKLINKGDPQKFYGISASNTIYLTSIATSKEQASLLYSEVSGHFSKCSFFRRYTANQTMSYARFQSPRDLEEFGAYEENPQARASIKVTFHACNAKGLRGAGNILVILDEVAHFIEAGGSSAEEVYQAIAPSVGAFTPKNEFKEPVNGPNTPTDGRIIMISSPLGKQGLFFHHFQEGFKGSALADNMLCVQAPTWEVNPTVSAQVFLEAYAQDPRVFYTEFGGEFTDRTLGWLEDHNDLLACIDKQLRPRTRGIPRRPYFVGFDFALVDDASAIAITHIDETNRIVLDYIGRMKAGEGIYANHDRLEFEDVANWIYLLSRQFSFYQMLFDQWGAIPLEQALLKKGITAFESKRFSPQERSEIWQNFKSVLWDKVGNQSRLVLYDISPEEQAKYVAQEERPPDHLEYIQELLSLQATYKSKYIVEVRAPKTEGKHDDMADALARSIWLASQSLGKINYIAGSGTYNDPNRPQVSARDKLLAHRKRLLGGSDPKRQIHRRR